jgi:sporulation protein YlmC with PRC-barrel domain
MESLTRLTDLLGARVFDADGHRLGHVFDVRCDVDGTRAVVGQLVFGGRGFLERLGVKEPTAQMIEWRDVAHVEPKLIRLRPGARPEEHSI